MTRVVIDASALAAFVFQEPGGEVIRQRLEGATVFAPHLLHYELASVAGKKIRRHPADGVKILRALALALDPGTNLVWEDVPAADAILLAQAAGVSTYDASYLWLAGSLGADLVTLDARLAKAAGTF